MGVLVSYSGDMARIRVRSFEKLRNVIENTALMQKIYRSMIPTDSQVISAVLRIYPHEGGCYIDEYGGRYWVYAEVRYMVNGVTRSYDIALWKIIKTASRISESALHEILSAIEIK